VEHITSAHLSPLIVTYSPLTLATRVVGVGAAYINDCVWSARPPVTVQIALTPSPNDARSSTANDTGGSSERRHVTSSVPRRAAVYDRGVPGDRRSSGASTSAAGDYSSARFSTRNVRVVTESVFRIPAFVLYMHLYSPKRLQQQIRSKHKTNADDRLTASLQNTQPLDSI